MIISTELCFPVVKKAIGAKIIAVNKNGIINLLNLLKKNSGNSLYFLFSDSKKQYKNPDNAKNKDI